MKSADGLVRFDKLDYSEADKVEEIVRFSFQCPNVKGRWCNGLLICGAPLGNGSVVTRSHTLHCWGWDGDVAKPSFSPSINCKSQLGDGTKAAGCGWHGHIQNGKLTGAK